MADGDARPRTHDTSEPAIEADHARRSQRDRHVQVAASSFDVHAILIGKRSKMQTESPAEGAHELPPLDRIPYGKFNYS
jgi:hypothetical protein